MSTSFSLSFELIYLMSWLLKNEKKQLEALIKDALKKGLADELETLDIYQDEEDSIAQLQDTILEFLMFLEDSLLESLEEKPLDKNTKNKLILDLKKISPRSIDLKTIWLSMQQAKNKLNKSQSFENIQSAQKEEITTEKDKDIKKLLFSQLLKNWKPKNNDPVN